MTPHSIIALLTLLCASTQAAQPDEFPLTEDSKVRDGVAKGELIKDKYLAQDGSVFPGTEREYAVYVPAGLDKTKPAPFMVFQDGVIYNAPTVFDNLIARKEIPAMIGIFIKPGVVPAVSDNALPRYNRSYEYDSVTDSYARFLIDEFLPAIKPKHGLHLSDDPNARGIAGNSSGGICAFMVAWHRPDQFRRVFTGVGTYVGIHGADQLPVLVRKFEPKPLRVFLQSGENDNNLYCGDWWLANQMMERSLSWNGYEVNHAWGTSGHTAKHASQIFPEVLRWLWKGYPNEPVKANPRGDAKWVGYSVIGEWEWEKVIDDQIHSISSITSTLEGRVLICRGNGSLESLEPNEALWQLTSLVDVAAYLTVDWSGSVVASCFVTSRANRSEVLSIPIQKAPIQTITSSVHHQMFAIGNDKRIYAADDNGDVHLLRDWKAKASHRFVHDEYGWNPVRLALSPDQTQLYVANRGEREIAVFQVGEDKPVFAGQMYGQLEVAADGKVFVDSMCVDTNGWLYVATSLGIQVLDQAGRVNFIIPTPKQPHDVCFGGRDLSDLFIACGDTIYKRPTKAHGYISGQMAPIKPPAPKL